MFKLDTHFYSEEKHKIKACPNQIKKYPYKGSMYLDMLGCSIDICLDSPIAYREFILQGCGLIDTESCDHFYDRARKLC